MQATSDDSKLGGGGAHYGWVMVFVGFSLTAMSFGALGSMGVFLKPIAAEFGWSRGSTALGYTTAAMGAAVFGILWGFLADRNPTMRFAMMGAITGPIAMFGLSQSSTHWQYYLSYFIFGAFSHGALVSPIWANIGQWFAKNKGTALGVALAGGAFGQAVVPFSARLLITSYDWQTAYMVLAAVFLLLGVIIASLTKDPPAKKARLAEIRASQSNGGSWSLGEARFTVTWFSIAVIFCCTCMAVPVVHVVPMLSDRGFDPQVAASVLTTLMLAGALGRMGAGRICDLIGPMRTYAAMSFMQASLVIWFPHIDELTSIYVLAACFGFSFSGVMACMVVSVNSMVPVQVGARSWSVVSFFGWVGMAIGSFTGGLLFDLTGDYFWSFTFAGVMGATNLVVLLGFHTSNARRQPLVA